jgi:hypothetical protein
MEGGVHCQTASSHLPWGIYRSLEVALLYRPNQYKLNTQKSTLLNPQSADLSDPLGISQASSSLFSFFLIYPKRVT